MFVNTQIFLYQKSLFKISTSNIVFFKFIDLIFSKQIEHIRFFLFQDLFSY